MASDPIDHRTCHGVSDTDAMYASTYQLESIVFFSNNKTASVGFNTSRTKKTDFFFSIIHRQPIVALMQLVCFCIVLLGAHGPCQACLHIGQPIDNMSIPKVLPTRLIIIDQPN